MVISLSKERMEELFIQFLEGLFSHSEIRSACVKKIDITRETMKESGRRAFEACYHDCYSDVDISVKVCLPKNGSVTSDEYMKRIDRFGVADETALGWMFVPVNNVCRVIFKNGMRYDLVFEFEYSDDVNLDMGEQNSEIENNPEWPVENINRFWFIQVQALGKLYRRDYLIGSHLANMNCNDTLVLQMIKRELEYGTSHHRYGYSEEPEYVKNLGKSPYKTDDQTFNRIADHLYAAAVAYDHLVKDFYPQYKDRHDSFFAIWDWYESCRANNV